MRAVASNAFHGSAQASSSRSGNTRVIFQGDAPTPKEVAGQRALRRHADAQAKQPKQPKQARQKRVDVKGKGKAESPTPIIEIDSTDEEGGPSAHRYEDADDPIDSDGDGERCPSTSMNGRAKKITRGPGADRDAYMRNDEHPSSPDPLSMNTARPLEHRSKAAGQTTSMRNASKITDSTLRGSIVAQRVNDYEARDHRAGAQTRTTVVGSLGRKMVSERVRGIDSKMGSPDENHL